MGTRNAATRSVKGIKEDAVAEMGGYDPVRAYGPLRQDIRLLRRQDAGRSPIQERLGGVFGESV